MDILIRADSVEIDGYVNAVERKSKPLSSRQGKFIERICAGAFQRALDRGDDVRLLLNHDRDLGGVKDGNLKLEEDNIGLRARATITDPEVIRKARNGELRGWSFGFLDRDVENKRDEDGIPLRDVKDLDLREVSILDNTKTPAYNGTLVMVRSDDEILIGEETETAVNIREEVPEQQETVEENKPNYDEADALIADMKS